MVLSETRLGSWTGTKTFVTPHLRLAEVSHLTWQEKYRRIWVNSMGSQFALSGVGLQAFSNVCLLGGKPLKTDWRNTLCQLFGLWWIQGPVAWYSNRLVLPCTSTSGSAWTNIWRMVETDIAAQRTMSYFIHGHTHTHKWPVGLFFCHMMPSITSHGLA